MADRQAWDLAFDPATGRRLTQQDVGNDLLLPSSRWPSFFSRVVARLQWDAKAIDLAPDARAWPELPDERRARLTALLAGLRVVEDAVAEHLAPFGQAANNSLVAWVLFLQRRDEQRHAMIFDRIAAEVLKLPGETKDERRDAAREHAPAGVLELFEERLPHLRCLIDAQPSPDVIDDVLTSAEEAAWAWGDAVPSEMREAIAPMCRHRLSVAKLLDSRAAAA